MLEIVLKRYPDLFSRLHETITEQVAFEVFQRIADTYAPSGTVSYTRGAVVGSLLAGRVRTSGLAFYTNYRRSGNVAIELGSSARKPVWCLAHGDICSYLTRECDGTRYRITPFCEPRKGEGSCEAVALAYDDVRGTMTRVAGGQLGMDQNGQMYFETDASDLLPFTRVCYVGEATWDQATGTITGYVDDGAGAAALVLAAQVLSHYDVEALLVLTDEEEGVVAPGNPAFSRGSARLFAHTPPDQLPDLVIVSDVHEEVAAVARGDLETIPFGRGALFCGAASEAKGGVTHPRLLAFQRELAAALDRHGVALHENPGYVSRSDCVSAMMATPNVALVGVPGAYSHFADTPRAHIADLVNLAKTLVVYILVAQDEAWQERCLG